LLLSTAGDSECVWELSEEEGGGEERTIYFAWIVYRVSRWNITLLRRVRYLKGDSILNSAGRFFLRRAITVFEVMVSYKARRIGEGNPSLSDVRISCEIVKEPKQGFPLLLEQMRAVSSQEEVIV